jgi:hypothetical protein
MAKEQRSIVSFYVSTGRDLVVVQWKDNAVVHVASNCYGVAPLRTAKRYSAADKKHITVPMPNAIHMYNRGMGGTDQLDRNVSQYRVALRNNKWWWQIFVHLLGASLSNSWLWYRMQRARVQEVTLLADAATDPGADDTAGEDDEQADRSHQPWIPQLDLLGFVREIVASYLLLHVQKAAKGRPAVSGNTVLVHKPPLSVTMNRAVLHYPDNFKQNCCRACRKNTTFGCGVCRINLHPLDCFKLFHEQQQ